MDERAVGGTSGGRQRIQYSEAPTFDPKRREYRTLAAAALREHTEGLSLEGDDLIPPDLLVDTPHERTSQSSTSSTSTPGAGKSLSFFGSSSGYRRWSLQYDSHQGSEISIAQGTEAKEREEKSSFDWFCEKSAEHMDTAKKERSNKEQSNEEQSSKERKCSESESEPCCISLYHNEDHPTGSLYGLEFAHQVFEKATTIPLIACGYLGSGSLGVAEEVKHSSSNFPSLVRKTVRLPYHGRDARLRIIQEEALNLRRMDHPHIVNIIASYEDKTRQNRHLYCLLMSPIGEYDLTTFLAIAGDASEIAIKLRYRRWIRSWFSCLACALEYMHNQGIRHQDIKPSNIIIKGRQVYFTDFSSASRFDVDKTTSTEEPARSSAMYGAPEVVSKRSGFLEKHGRLSDIFSLGAVFCEMLTVTEGRTVHAFHDYLCLSLAHGDDSDTSSESSFFGGVLLFITLRL
ncbi:kinase-like domain-containing protein [Lophiotrema nucula]|uniref:Kinase-like domain-containing protein n=1 Tax=Lophiotrema nucula TaxID=690887 RepID=A0A6A5Z5V1_9PLEO|nr:kinase-like domain-containing protein [Lophiotrema nucula]